MSMDQSRPRVYAAVDLGASSGRVMSATMHGGDVLIEEIHRFANGPALVEGALCWEADRLFDETLDGLSRVARSAHSRGAVFAGIGIDSWGVDYGLLDGDGTLMSRVKHHRGADPNGPASAEETVSAADAYRVTGIPAQAINTSYQLRADVQAAIVRGGERVLLIPDLWVHRLTGQVGAERTIASTTQLFDARESQWATALIEAFGLGGFVFPPPSDSGTLAGHTTPEMTARIGALEPVPVYRVAGHDTASALAFAEPTGSELLISCGSWSLVGVCVSRPVLSSAARAAGFTNESGVDGSTLLLRNLAGMWLLTECSRVWAERGETDADAVRLADLAAGAVAERPPIFDVGDARLLEPGDMPARIAALCVERGEQPPSGVVGTVRSIIESLATAYADTAQACAQLTGISPTSVRIVGGGSRNNMLCERTAALTGLPVTAGPAEASALGNLAVQLVANGEFDSVCAVFDSAQSADLPRLVPGSRPFSGDRTFSQEGHS